ncbi:alpha/beta hydrolase [Arthrobacter castelli]|uniref:alpha/beta hydrolase n=1 Tax=Arthrobacter castelli TaxID=271431 RepID=UPI0004002BA3|nr:alpha/beta hydrolase [Arthrobacter castelli]
MATAILEQSELVSTEIYPAAPGFFGPRPSVLVLPGGAFREHTGHEGEGYARWLSDIGLHAFVVNYRLLPHGFPAPLEDARAGLHYIRHGDHGLSVDTARVGVIGSSAGGHLAGLLMVGTVLSIETLDEAPPRPDFAILAYAVADLDLLPGPAVEALLGERINLKDELSPVRHLDERVCPAFVWATAEDPPGFPNALAWATALVDASVAVELHIYPHGWHGLGLADGQAYGDHGHTHIPHTAQWSSAAESWLREECFLE